MQRRKVFYQKPGRITLSRIGKTDPMDVDVYETVICPQVLWDALCLKIQTQIDTRCQTVGPHKVNVDGRDMWTGYAESLSSDPKPNTLTSISSSRKPSKSSRYPSVDGSIVMNPYSVGKVTITEAPGEEVISSTSASAVNTCPKSLGVPWFAIVPYKGGHRYFLDARHFVTAETGLVFVMPRMVDTSRWSMPADLGGVPTADYVRSKILTSYEMDLALIQAAEAAANERFIDLTTELAELPETIKMVLDGFRTVVRLVRDVKDKKLSLSKSFEKRKKYLKKKLDRALASINLERRGADRYRRRVLDREARRARRSFANALAESAREFADAVANTWLQFRYGIMPVVHTVDSIKELIKSLGSEYITTRERDQADLTIDVPIDFGGEWSFPCMHRVTIKQRFDQKVSTFWDVMDRLSGNLLLTAWELLPLSFVVDWFIDVGNFLSSLNPTAEWDAQARSYSFKSDHTLRHSLPNNSVLIVKTEIYKRDLIPDDALTGLTLGSGLNLFRSFDALALLWSPIKALLISSKKG